MTADPLIRDGDPAGENRGERAVLFDFDGTLFDASEAIARSFNAALRETGRPEWPRERIVALIGRPLAEMFPLAAPDAPASEIGRMISSYRAVFLPLSVPMTREMPGLRPCLDALARGGYRLAIVTNRGGAGARHILSGFGLAGAFEFVLGLEDALRAKPDPEPVHRALDRLRIRAERAVLVGDTREDMRAASAAGVRGIGVLNGSGNALPLLRAGAAAVIPGLAGLPDLLRRLFPPG